MCEKIKVLIVMCFLVLNKHEKSMNYTWDSYPS